MKSWLWISALTLAFTTGVVFVPRVTGQQEHQEHASPLRKALIESGLGDSLTGGGYGNYMKYGVFSTGLKAINAEDARRVELFYSTIHPCECKLAIFRLPQPPAEFPDTDDGYTGLLHELHILLEPVVGHILRVIRYAVQHGIHAISPERFAGLSFPR